MISIQHLFGFNFNNEIASINNPIFQYNTCLGSTLQLHHINLLLAYFNTTLVWVQLVLWNCLQSLKLNFNTTLVWVQLLFTLKKLFCYSIFQYNTCLGSTCCRVFRNTAKSSISIQHLFGFNSVQVLDAELIVLFQYNTCLGSTKRE